jgi:galactose-1-phosphate uridylyltransferase
VSELRQDPITRDWVIINPAPACPFCPGHEADAPRASEAITAPDGHWLVRAVPNKFPVLSTPPEAVEHGATLGTMPAVSPETRRRVNDEIAYFDEHGHCGLCQVIADERGAGERMVLETRHFVSQAPYASSGPYQLHVAPLRHCPTFLEIDAGELDDLAVHLTRVVAALRACLGEPHYKLVVSSPPLDRVHRSASHWFIEILPRITTPAGFELGSRIVVNVKAPEKAAHELRAALNG